MLGRGIALLKSRLNTALLGRGSSIENNAGIEVKFEFEMKSAIGLIDLRFEIWESKR